MCFGRLRQNGVPQRDHSEPERLENLVAQRPTFTGIRYQEQVMSVNKDQVKGRVKEVKGKIKEVAGKLVGNKTMRATGKIQKLFGAAQAKFGDVKQDMKGTKKGA